MQILRIKRSDMTLFCPITGHRVLDDQGEPVASSVRAVWHEARMDDPTILDQRFEDEWADHLEELREISHEAEGVWVDDKEDLVFMDDFLAEVDRPGWVGIECTVPARPGEYLPQVCWTVLDLQADAWR